MTRAVSAGKVIRTFPELLDRVRQGGMIVVEQDGKPICKINPLAPRGFTGADFAAALRAAPKPDPGFWDDVEDGIRLMNRPEPLREPWEH